MRKIPQLGICKDIVSQRSLAGKSTPPRRFAREIWPVGCFCSSVTAHLRVCPPRENLILVRPSGDRGPKLGRNDVDRI